MKVLVVGGGGREHALVWRLAQDREQPELFCAPGNSGTSALAHNLAISASDGSGLLEWARRERPDLTVVGPEAPLCDGLVDVFQGEGLAAFGPCRAAARLEGSKVFAKEIMASAGAPTARSAVFEEFEQAVAYLRKHDGPCVIKADGLAAGKGVHVCPDAGAAVEALRETMVKRAFGDAGQQVVIEEFLEGEELSVLAFTDGENVAFMPAAQDHKRVGDGDQGPNTGGMGAYAPTPIATGELLDQAREKVFLPVLAELRRRGIRYRGVLYAGLMATSAGLRVLEFNARFGDPETQAILPLLDRDLIPLMRSCIEGGLANEQAPLCKAHAACVIMAASGYPGAFRKGDPIAGLVEAAAMPEVLVFHAGAKLENGATVTAGGRVLGVTGLGASLSEALNRAYAAVSRISFPGAHWRKDIGARSLGRSGGL